MVTDEKIVNGIETMYFKGRCSGTMALVPCAVEGKQAPLDGFFDHWECWIQVRSKPWWLPRAVLDWGFREALK